MAVAVEAFLVLEKSLASRLSNAWRRDAAKPAKEISRLVERGEFEKAVDLCEELALGPSAERNRKFAEFVGRQAVLFGASRLTAGNPRRTTFAGGKTPEHVERAAQNLITTLEFNATESVCRTAIKLLGKERAAQQEAAYKAERRKEASPEFVGEFESFVRSNGNSYINIGSSLHTSRLASWGFTVEAEARGVESYQVSEQLDGRTCPVCRTMDGTTFDLAPARAKLESQLSTTDPNELKSIAAWPKQDKTSVNRLGKMTTSQLQEQGWNTPPFHPLCRGVLVEAGSIPVRVDQVIDELQTTVGDVTTAVPFAMTPAAMQQYSADGYFLINETEDKGPLNQVTVQEGWEEFFGNDTPEQVYAQMAAGSTKSKKNADRPGFGRAPDTLMEITIQVRNGKQIAEVKTPLWDKDGYNIGRLVRDFEADGKGNKKAYLAEMIFDKAAQSSGRARKILASTMQYLVKSGYKEMSLDANVDVGGYAWARYGAFPTQDSWDDLRYPDGGQTAGVLQFRLESIEKSHPSLFAEVTKLIDSSDPKNIWKVADLRTDIGGVPAGKYFLLNTSWAAKVPLDDAAALARFKGYIGG